MRTAKQTIILIDDDKWLTDLYGEKLRLENFRVYTASNGKDGFELISKRKPDLVLCDVVMTDGDGFYVMNKLKKSVALRDTPVLTLTNLSNESDRAALLNMGALDYLVKADHTPSQVVEKIRRALAEVGKAEAPAKLKKMKVEARAR